MKKLLAAIVAGLFAVSMTAPVAAQDKKDGAKKEMKKGETKKTDGKAKAGAKKTDGKAKAGTAKTDGKAKAGEKKK